jgi:hypothetical protein
MGAVRVVITANNRNLLTGHGELTPEDVQAICARLLHVTANARAAEYLHQLPRARRAAFVGEDEIAKHALWLRDNRKVIPGSRFLVEGRPDALVRALVHGQGLRAAICHWLAQWLLEPSKMAAHSSAPYLAVRDGRIEASARGVHGGWEVYITNYRGGTPSISAVNKALHGLTLDYCNAKIGGSTVKHAVIDPLHIVQWAEEQGYASAEDIHVAIQRAGERTQGGTMAVAMAPGVGFQGPQS